MSHQTIPDITYHLIFCFIPLDELPVIEQCCKEWKRIVTEPLFLNMFPAHAYFSSIENQNLLASNTPFLRVIRKIQLSNYYYCTNFDFCKSNFLKALQLLSELKSLYLQTNLHNSILHFLTPSFLYHMKKLESFRFEQLNGPIQYVNQIGSLPELTELKLDNLNEDINFNVLREICHHPSSSQYVKLKHLGKFQDISLGQENECVQLLNKLTHLQTIDIHVNRNLQRIPTLLGKWIHHLSIDLRKLRDEDVTAIISLSNLKSIELWKCKFNNLQINHLIAGLSSRLEVLYILYDQENFEISFQTLCQCIRLKSLSLFNVLGFEEHHPFDVFGTTGTAAKATTANSSQVWV